MENIIKESDLLPSHYSPVTQPAFNGKGNHSVFQLEAICEGYEELVHQLRIREQTLLREFNITIVK